MKTKVVLLVVFLFTIQNISYAAEGSLSKENDTLLLNESAVVSAPLGTQPSISTIDYKLLYEVQKSYSSDILSTVYWSLGSILGLLVFFLGSNVFFYYRFNKKGYEKFVAETNERIDAQERGLAAKLDSKNKEYFDKLELSNNERIGMFSEVIEKQIETLEERIKLVSEQNKSSLKLMETSLKHELHELDERFSKDICDNITVIKKNHNDSKFDILGLEADIWDLTKVFANSLTYRINQLIMVNNSEVADWKYEFVLKDILALVKNKKPPLYNDTQKILKESLSEVPSAHALQVQEILKTVKSMKIEEL